MHNFHSARFVQMTDARPRHDTIALASLASTKWPATEQIVINSTRILEQVKLDPALATLYASLVIMRKS